MPKLEERVARGVSWLDSRKPGWRDQIDTRTLNLRSCEHCVIGQVFGWAQVEDFSLNNQRAVYAFLDNVPDNYHNYGFAAGYDPDDPRGASYPELTAEWKRQIHTEQPKAKRTRTLAHA